MGGRERPRWSLESRVATSANRALQTGEQIYSTCQLLLQHSARRLITNEKLSRCTSHSGPATFRGSRSSDDGSLISSHDTASRGSPVVDDTAKRTPSELAAVERKSARGVEDGR